MFRSVLLGLGLLLATTAAGQTTVPTQVRMINDEIEQGWKDYQISRPAPEADDVAWCRRVYLDVIGRIPSYDELAAFKSERGSDKRAKLVERLLHDDKYTEEYAAHWATTWTNLLIGQSGGNDRRSMTSRDGMKKYLRDSFAANKPYNKMVYELVTAGGCDPAGRGELQRRGELFGRQGQ